MTCKATQNLNSILVTFATAFLRKKKVSNVLALFYHGNEITTITTLYFYTLLY